jgi:N-ethylmaleimide reductase
MAGDLSLANRIVMAPLTRNRAPGAVPTELMGTYYTQRASAGLLITEATAISPQAQGYAQVPGIWSTKQVAAWKRITKRVHEAGGRIVMQLWHVGRVSHVDLQPEGQAPVAPSAIRANTKTVLIDAKGAARFEAVSEPRALTTDELPGIINDYRQAARHAIDAGFDGVEVHAANGYLIDQFLRSGSNHRSDDWGGTIANRARFLRDVMVAVCNEVGSGKVGIRLSPVTAANDAIDAEPQPLFEHVMRLLAPMKLAYVHIIEGQTGGDRQFTQGSGPFNYAGLRAAYLESGGTGAWMVNNAYSRDMADQAMLDGANLVAFGRLYIANPDLVDRLRTHGPYNTPDRATFYGGGEAGYTDYLTRD